MQDQLKVMENGGPENGHPIRENMHTCTTPNNFLLTYLLTY